MLLRCGYWIWVAAVVLISVKFAQGQGETTSAIVGSVTDPAGAAIPGATVTVANIENGLKRSVTTDDSGRFSFPQLKPGVYAVKAEADRFETQRNNSVSAGLGQSQTVDFKLNVASQSETIVVQEQAPLINPENANTSTTLTAHSLEDLPNPGGDLTYPLQFAPGSHRHGRQRERFCRRHEWLWKRAVQWLAISFERLYRRWPGNQRSADQPK